MISADAGEQAGLAEGAGAGNAWQSVRADLRDGIAVLTLDNPPVNLLDARLRSDLMAALDAMAAEPQVRAVVLTGAGSVFSTGLDMRELDAPMWLPRAGDLALRIETLGKPVVAAIHGQAAGAGLELALAATARVVRADALLSLPDMAMGLPPGAGGTQRLPRLIGAAATLEMILSGRTGVAMLGVRRALCDLVITGAPLEAAVALAQDLVAAPRPMTQDRRDGFADPAGFAAEIAQRRAEVDALPIPAARDALACVEAAMLLPFDAGLAMEAAVFADAMAGSQSRALRHIALAERRSHNMPETRPRAARAIGRVGVVGGGASAAGLAAGLLDAGLPVVQFERSREAVAAIRGRVSEQPVATGTRGAGETRMAQWSGTSDLTDLAGCDLIVEAVAEVPRTKAQVFAALARIAGPDTILASQSGLLSITAMAEAAGDRAAQVCGMHLHAPFAGGRLAEVIPGPQTAPWVVASLAALAQTVLGRVVLRAGTGGGALGERVLAAARDAALAMLAEGVPPERIDRVMAEWGLPAGVFRQIDSLGLAVVLARGRLLARDPGFPAAHLDALARLVAAGRDGRAAGQGIYLWPEGGRARSDDSLFAALFEAAPPEPVRLDESEICLRLIAAMANEGTRMLRAGLALRPADIDLAMVLGQGFPRWRGGPMQAADDLGLFEVLRALKRLAPAWPALYAPEPGIAALVKNGARFASLNGVGRARRGLPD